jgi:hypothetical protein
MVVSLALGVLSIAVLWFRRWRYEAVTHKKSDAATVRRLEITMRFIILFAAFLLLTLCATRATAGEGDFTASNPRIDFATFLRDANATHLIREGHRLSEARFIELSQQPGVVVLDARSQDKFNALHVAGAINLPYTDFSEPSLAKVLPDKQQVILIYCNNNFERAPKAFAPKSAVASLNISTFISLHSYGYKNVFELGPLLDVHTTKITLVGRKE